MRSWQEMEKGKEKYQFYLASREWAIKREQVRKRSRGICERCHHGSAAQVHHQTYERVYQEQLDDLVHLCAGCHEYLSAKRHRDPMKDAPVMIGSTIIKTVYLAGKITGTVWRDQIATNWSGRQSCLDECELDENLRKGWPKQKDMVVLPDGRELDYVGPLWRAPEEGCGHGGSPSAVGLHASGQIEFQEHNQSFAVSSPPFIAALIRQSIRNTDLVFAWIDSFDCFGTLVEIGFANAEANGLIKKYIVVGVLSGLNTRELWVAKHFADQVIVADSPGKAWEEFWKDPLTKRREYEVEVHEYCPGQDPEEESKFNGSNGAH